ncbi:hypothetical protein A1OW_18225 [Enterovibrio norvegicus]|uniref:hypothetical protein n=1 Tax=Enterovibrio norvegicus TaxID=188144 RepID=UPI00038158BC|nr:hypothetical protein [Enterovibrio norvegicus]OEF63295.1 hypothetical protein A1OW_18225 [Enterovibrio norvegicus]
MELHRDTVTLLKLNGDEINNIKASVQRGMTFIKGSNILIETGDLIRREMSNGAVETYEVIDPGFHEGGSLIGAGYQIIHKNLGLPEAEKAIQNITYNLSGNSKFNNNSVDNSTNNYNYNSELSSQFDALRLEVRALLEGEKQIEALEVVSTIEQQFKSEKPNNAIVTGLLAALPHTESIASIASSIASCLSS